ncbi:MAG: oligosaccharide flippase family protein [Bacteroidales bacterium]|jgi:lipopolysaccharide exporter|nr:oligosaccharide flippase family protein [Bacteroidales bacterium]
MAIFHSDYIRNISKVSIGVLIAQSLSILAAPILTRLYSPAEFGIFSVYVSVVLTIEVCACLRYEMTIVLAEKESNARCLFWLSSVIMTMASILVGVVVIAVYFITKNEIIPLIKWNDLFLLMPLSVFAISMVNVISLWCTRKKFFSIFAFIQAGLVIINNLLSILAGHYIAGEGRFLVYSQLASYVIIMILSGLYIFYKDKSLLLFPSWRKLISLFIEYKRMALYNTPASIINIFSQRLPAYTFPISYGLPSVGYYDLVYRILKLPSQVVGNAIRNVFFQKASEDFKRSATFACSLQNNVNALVRISAFPFFIFGALSIWLFPILFGKEWADSGWYVLALLPWLMSSFIVVPISSAVSITAQDKAFFRLQIICFVTRIMVIIIGIALFSSPLITILCFSIVGCIFQLLILRIIARSTGLRLLELFDKRIVQYVGVSFVIALIAFLFVLTHLYWGAVTITVLGSICFVVYIKMSFVK